MSGDQEFSVAESALIRVPALRLREAVATKVDVDPDDPVQCAAYVCAVAGDPLVREALEISSRSLARTLEAVDRGEDVPAAGLRRAVFAVTKYFLRMSTRPTPFGLFAGVDRAAFGHATRVERAGASRKAVRPDMEWLLTLVRRWETAPEVLCHLRVAANNLCLVRGDRLVLPYVRTDDGDETHETSVRHVPAVQLAYQAARTAPAYPALVLRLREAFPGAREDLIASMLGHLIEHEFLITDLRPPSYCADPLDHVLGRLAPITSLPEVAALREVDRARRAYERRPAGRGRPHLRTLMTAMDRLHVVDRPVQVDMRAGVRVTLPPAVVEEIESVVTVLRRLTPNRTAAHLPEYHGRFVERYGLAHAVPLAELVDPDRGLGVPSDYIRPRGASPQPSPLTEAAPSHARLLAALAQRASRAGAVEVLLEAGQIDELTVDDGEEALSGAVELPVTVLANSRSELNAGEFRVVLPPSAGSAEAGAFSGRFLHLFDAAERGPAPVAPGAVPAQLTFLPFRSRLANVSQVPAVHEHMVAIGAYPAHDGPHVLGMEDLAVYADQRRLRVMSRSLGREIMPMPLHLMNLYIGAPNAARLLSEISQTGKGIWRGWQWGPIRHLPFLPRVRYGRTVLASARWTPPPALCDAATDWLGWQKSFQAWRTAWAVPDEVEATVGDQRFRLDLSAPLHRRLLRHELRRQPDLALYEIPCGGEFGSGWLEDRVNEIVVTLTPRQRSASGAGLPVPAPVSRPRHHPGGSWLYAKLYVSKERHDDLLAADLPRLTDAVLPWTDRWFFVRYHDPEPHLRLRLHGERAVLAKYVLPLLHDWAATLCAAGLARNLTLDTYEPECLRYGGEHAMEAAEQLFCADSNAAVAQLRLRREGLEAVPLEVLAAANHVDLLQRLDDERWQEWLLATYPRGPYHASFQRHRAQALRLVDPGGEWAGLRTLPRGRDVLDAWQRRAAAAAAYGEVLRGLTREGRAEGWTMAVNSVLHMHHNRLVGTDRERESASYAIARGAVQAYRSRREHGR